MQKFAHQQFDFFSPDYKPEYIVLTPVLNIDQMTSKLSTMSFDSIFTTCVCIILLMSTHATTNIHLFAEYHQLLATRYVARVGVRGNASVGILVLGHRPKTYMPQS